MDIRKVVINSCFGGFGLSDAAMKAYWARKGKTAHSVGSRMFVSHFDEPMPQEFALPEGQFMMPLDHPEYERYSKWYSDHVLENSRIPRDDPDLIAVVEELGRAADGACASLEIVEIPGDVEWVIEEYDGNEHIAEAHRTWP